MSKEMLDIYNEQQEHIGVAPRDEVHEKGYLHHTFHCWIIRSTPEGPQLLFQKRQDTKDTFPGYFDITAAGHLTAGETIEHAAREIQEELGVNIEFSQLVSLGTVQYEGRGIANGKAFIDRETCFVFGCQLDIPLSSYQLQAEELAGLYETPLEQAIAMFAGEIDSIHAVGISSVQPGTDFPHSLECHVSVQQFVPQSGDYYLHTLRGLAALPSLR
ncbi:NUDIX hydrolase [Paenibacillus pini]|uniref:Nudix hydrolase domain-containing protein n=1 Tax=Paenibacillus pini JCM 16418 TaxID=1236976 RepID=W7YPF8_9BACL|nr:NUDIX domain-containing protein [Paenibacillus pini]GAF09523.1 hypothetical protein JCM16418_3666 [Paenibacillus pini JCM 16418]